MSLLECYFRSRLSNYGVTNIGELGAALKGKVSGEIGSTLAQVTNAVERAELIEEAALLLRAEPSLLEDIVNGSSTVISNRGRDTVEVLASSADEELGRIPEVSALPLLDQEVLLAAMAEKHGVPTEILRDAELCSVLAPSSLMFIDGLRAVFGVEATGGERMVTDRNGPDSPEAQKERIRELLKKFGLTWKIHWRLAHEMAQYPGARVDEMLRQCRLNVRKNKLNQAIKEIDRRLTEVSDDCERVCLHQERLQMARQLQSVSQLGSS